MANSLCGPSNSLQSLQKHASTDRTLQQDRVLARESPLQGFRSLQIEGPGVLDAEFEAFHADRSFEGEVLRHNVLDSDRIANQHRADFNEPRLPNWALDFQALIEDDQTSPISSSQLREQAPLHISFQRGLHAHSLRRDPQALAPQGTQQQPEPSGSFGQNHAKGYNVSSQPYSTFSTHNVQPCYQELSVDDESQRAFDDAFQSIDAQAEYTHQELSADDESQRAFDDTFQSIEEKTESTHQDSLEDIQLRGIGPLPHYLLDRIDKAIEYTSRDQPGSNDADELARTAGELLDHLKPNKSMKFLNSTFCSFVRQLRDREVYVKGDKIVETPHPLHPGGEDYPQASISNRQKDGLYPNDTTMTWEQYLTDSRTYEDLSSSEFKGTSS